MNTDWIFDVILRIIMSSYILSLGKKKKKKKSKKHSSDSDSSSQLVGGRKARRRLRRAAEILSDPPAWIGMTTADIHAERERLFEHLNVRKTFFEKFFGQTYIF